MKTKLLLAVGALLFVVPAQAQMIKLKPGVKKGMKAKKKAGLGPDNLEIKEVSITKVERNEVELRLNLFKPGAQERHKVRIEFVDGRQIHRLWEKDVKFAGTRGGFVNTATIDIRNKNLRRGEVKITVVECAKRPKCKKIIRLNKGDLYFGAPKTEKRGSQSIVTIEVKNKGPVDGVNCKAIIKIDGRKVKEVAVNGLRVGASKKVEVRYDNNKRRKPATAELKCADLSPANNVKRFKLK